MMSAGVLACVSQWLEEFQALADQNADGVITLAEMTDMFHGARARAVEREIQLRPQLTKLSVTELRERAKREGAHSDAVIKAASSSNPERQLIQLICAVEEIPPLQRPRRYASADGACSRCMDASFAPRHKETSREIVAEKVRNNFFDQYSELVWDMLSHDVFDADRNGAFRWLCGPSPALRAIHESRFGNLRVISPHSCFDVAAATN